ncbi:FAD-binding oxidoreductase [Dysgonomonas sp.]|uniref:NAD(P)/FAD-dependent oxidoreductase n=1 Tax=Dysgonomonas TaxID=156973 RepID=UPI0027B8E02E|nr:FAD-dependent oxidoreductase [Dysgonomonas sp.]
MDLYSGLPYWIAKNSLYNYFNPLKSDFNTDVIIIGAGITGALVAHELCNASIQCAVVDKRSITTGSSTASTALLQYEIDTPLCNMVELIEEDLAVLAYRSCLQSITDIENVFKSIGFNPDFERVPSVFFASDKKGLKLIEREYEIRQKYKLPVTFLDKKALSDKYGFKASGALENDESAQIDAYKAATHLIDYHIHQSGLKVFTNTEVVKYREKSIGYELQTTTGYKINSKYVIIAAGFEAGKFLPKQVMKLTSTYALVSEPVDEKYIWHKKSLIWETKEPYIYIRTDNKNRIIVGGEDEDFKDPVKRDSLLRKKVSILEKKIKKLFPHIPFKTDMAWCGTFSSTDDGLPYIGTWPGVDRMFYALGYGGNGITFSMIAAQLIKNKLKGIEDEREDVFSFARKRK